jgi:hypothetical protein
MNCTEKALYASKRSVERLIFRARLQHRILMRTINDIERERRASDDTPPAAEQHSPLPYTDVASESPGSIVRVRRILEDEDFIDM